MTVLGAVCVPYLPPERLRDIARMVDDSALDELWLWEDCFWTSGIACAAAVLGWTERVRVGVGLLPVPLRNVAITAMELATLHRLFPGRASIGVGHGVQDWMGQVGARAESPLTLLREQLQALRGLLHGERVELAGQYVRLDNVALGWPPVVAPPLVVGATGPRTLRLAGELADATILTASTTPDGVRHARQLIDEGRTAVGRTDPHRLIVYVAAEWRGEVPDPGVAGDAATIADSVYRWAEAGADTVVLQPTADDPDLEGFVRFVATEVAPLVTHGRA